MLLTLTFIFYQQIAAMEQVSKPHQVLCLLPFPSAYINDHTSKPQSSHGSPINLFSQTMARYWTSAIQLSLNQRIPMTSAIESRTHMKESCLPPPLCSQYSPTSSATGTIPKHKSHHNTKIVRKQHKLYSSWGIQVFDVTVWPNSAGCEVKLVLLKLCIPPPIYSC